MANPVHLNILKRGIETWNSWREESATANPNLQQADLSDADLCGVDFSGTNLCEANLNGINLSHAKLFRASLDEADLIEANLDGANLNCACLEGANLTWANLCGANLSKSQLKGGNFNGANLSRADLREANLREADLREANLHEANLSGADLREANLREADLRRANLRGANLSEAKLCLASLDEADLHGTSLYGTDLSSARLRGTNFSAARFGCTLLAALDLSEARGLESAHHAGPSSIGLDTFFYSEGKLPECLLRGAGVPDVFLRYAASYVSHPTDFCFISYSPDDAQLARRLHADLQAEGLRCWLAPEVRHMFGDRLLVHMMGSSIKHRDKLLLLLSVNSVSSKSTECDVHNAFNREHRDKRTIVIPIRLDDAVMQAEEGWSADIRRTRHIGDFTHWKDHDAYQRAFDRLLRDLRANLK